jgi:hypothetical protein
MSSIPSFITNITLGIYGSSYEDDLLVEQFRNQLGLSPSQAIPDTTATEKEYIAFLSSRVTVLQFMSTLSTQLLGSTGNLEAEIAGFRSSLGLDPQEPIPNTEASKEAFVNYLTTGKSALISIASITKDVYGSATAIIQLLDGFRTSIGLLPDQPIPDNIFTMAIFVIFYLPTQSSAFAFISRFTQLVTGTVPTDAQLIAFRGYLGLEPGEAIPDDYTTSIAYINFLGMTNDFATYAASTVKNAYGTSIVQNISLLSEFRADLNLTPDTSIPSDADTKHAFLYFLTSPTILAAQGFYGISQAAADSIALFRATLTPSLSSGTPIPTDDSTLQKYLKYLHDTGTLLPKPDITIFMQDTVATITGSPLTNEILAQFRAYLRLKSSDAIPNTDSSKALFMSFLQENLAAVKASEAINAISPHEDAVRRVLFTAFSMIMDMLNTLQQSSRVESKALQIYAEWEKEYTNLITATPIYGPTVANSIVANDIDFGETTLGADNVTVRQVARWLLQQIQTTGETEARFTVRNPVFTNTAAGGNPTAGFPTFLMKKNADGSYNFSLQNQLVGPDGFMIGNYWPILSATATLSSSLSGQEQNDGMINDIFRQITTKWNNNQYDLNSFNLYTYTYSRDSNGILNVRDPVYLTLNPSYLHTLWSGKADATTFDWTDNTFGDHNHIRSTYYEWSDGYIDTNLPTDITMSARINQALAVMNTNNYTDYYTSCGTIQDGIVAHNDKAFLLHIHLDSATSTTKTFSLSWTRGEQGPGWQGWNDISTLSWTYDWYPAEEGSPFTANILNSYVGSGLWGPWNGPGAGAWPETMPYPSSYSKTSLQNVRSQSSSYVGEINAQLQQYLQSSQARKTNLDSSMKVMQNLMTQTTQAISNQTNLLDAIMQSLKSILTSIFH